MHDHSGSNDRHGTFSRPWPVRHLSQGKCILLKIKMKEYTLLVESDGQGTAKNLLSIITH
jgi:hypothetical protein